MLRFCAQVAGRQTYTAGLDPRAISADDRLGTVKEYYGDLGS